MKLPSFSAKKLFRYKKSPRSVSRSDNSFSSIATSSSSDESHAGITNPKGVSTPTSVLPNHVSSAWREADLSAESTVYSELVLAFKLIDKNGDGKIEKGELAALLSRVGAEPPSDDELTVMLSEVDKDGDGCVSLEEFGEISSALAPPACDAELREAFDFFDADHDGRITAEELYKVFREFGDGGCTLEDCRRMIKGVDVNGDGFVCFEDFTRMMEQQR